jgi:hypothetical protein
MSKNQFILNKAKIPQTLTGQYHRCRLSQLINLPPDQQTELVLEGIKIHLKFFLGKTATLPTNPEKLLAKARSVLLDRGGQIYNHHSKDPITKEKPLPIEEEFIALVIYSDV